MRHLLITAGLLLFFSAASLAQTSSLEGDVKDENGKPRSEERRVGKECRL